MRSYRTSSNYTSNSYNAGISSSSKKTTTTTSNNNREDYRSTQYSSQPKTNTFKTSKTSFNDGVGKSNLDNYEVKKVPGIGPASLILNAAQKLRQKSFEANLKFFREKVLTSKNRGGYKNTLESYSSYMKSRLAGTTDAYGNTINKELGKGDINKYLITKNIGGSTIQTTAPTEAEVSQSETANADAAALKVKKRGRSASILTGPKGVTKMASNYSLGKKSLLGRV